MNMKSRINLGKYKSFSKYSKNIFKESLITSLPEIATSKSCTKRLIKILVFIFCVIGFIYQTLDFLRLYFSYSTVVNVLITNPFEVEQPAITLCNINRQRRSFVCTREHNDCRLMETSMFCMLYSVFCPGRRTEFPYLYDQNTKYSPPPRDWDYSAQAGHNESMINGCTKEVDGKKLKCELPYKKVPVVADSGEPNFCYTIESQWGNPDANPNFYPNTFRIDLDIKIQPEEYLSPYDSFLARITVHDRKTNVNPYKDGYVLKGGFQYDAYVSMTSQERLPHPYDTNCTDYLKLWRENNGTGPLNDLMCIEQCKLNKLLELGLCVDKNIAYPHMEQICPRHNPSLKSGVVRDCTMQCQPPCRDQKFEVRYEEVGTNDQTKIQPLSIDLIGNYSTCNGDRWCQVERTKVNFIFNNFRHTKYIYQTKFESVELFSYVGGYMGMWLGLSLVSMFDLVETFSYLLFYPIGRVARAHQKKRIMCAPNQHEKSATVY